MTKFGKQIGLGILALVILLGLPAIFARSVEGTRPAPDAPADLDLVTVMVKLDGGHGSGVVIGDGTMVLTAAHVAEGAKDGNVIIVTHDGRELVGTVGWIATGDDVAIILLDETLVAAPVQCETAAVGTAVEIVGHPAPGKTLEWMHTWGHVGAYYVDFPGWGPIIFFDATVFFGNSGGPMFSEAGEVVGIVVAMTAANLGYGVVAPFGFNIAVPASRICELMGWANDDA